MQVFLEKGKPQRCQEVVFSAMDKENKEEKRTRSIMVAPLRLRGEKNPTNHDHPRHLRSLYSESRITMITLISQIFKS